VAVRLPLALAVVAVLLGGAALVVALTRDDGDELHRVVVANESGVDATVDKDVQVFCPDGYTPVGGGGIVPHGSDTPGVAIYWSGPYRNGWEVAAQDTRRRRRPWVLTAQVVCLKPVHEDVVESGALPARTTRGR
jgi:hypothetical protein